MSVTHLISPTADTFFLNDRQSCLWSILNNNNDIDNNDDNNTNCIHSYSLYGAPNDKQSAPGHELAPKQQREQQHQPPSPSHQQ